MVFLEEFQDATLEATKILQLRERPFPLDVVVKKRAELDDPLVAKMLEHKRVLYDGLKLFSS